MSIGRASTGQEMRLQTTIGMFIDPFVEPVKPVIGILQI
jgi:hypothetical protein